MTTTTDPTAADLDAARQYADAFDYEARPTCEDDVEQAYLAGRASGRADEMERVLGILRDAGARTSLAALAARIRNGK